MTPIAAVIWRFERATTEKVTLRASTAEEELLRGPRRVGAHREPPAHGLRVVALAVADGDLGRQLVDRLVENSQVVLRVVRPGVARPQQRRKSLARGIREAEHGVVAKAALVRRRRPLLVLGMDGEKRRVDVEHDRSLPARKAGLVPDVPTHARHRLLQFEKRLLADLVAHRPIERRVRRHRAEERRLLAQLLDVKATLASSRQHQHRLHEDLAPVVDRRHMTAPRDRRRQCIGQPEAVGETSKGMQPDVADDPGAPCFHPHGGRAASFHLGSALLVRPGLALRTTSFPYREGVFASCLCSATWVSAKNRG
jgi:hypothetical protein